MRRLFVTLFAFLLASVLTFACATFTGQQAKQVAFDCAAALATDAFSDTLKQVDSAMSVSQAEIKTKAVQYGIDAVKCAVDKILADLRSTPSLGPDPRVQNGIAWRKANP